LPKTNDQVTTEQTRRTRQRQREEVRDHLTESVKRLVQDHAEITPEMEHIIDRLQSLMRRGTGDELEAILGRLVGPDQARNTAYDILLRAGRINPDTDRFLVISGIKEAFSAEQTEAAAALVPALHTNEREDFRNLPAISIDDEDTVEIDDALTIR